MREPEEAAKRLKELLRDNIKAAAAIPMHVESCGNIRIGAHSQITIHVDCPLPAEVLKLLQPA